MPSGRAVTVSDVAEVSDGDAEPTSYVTYQSRESGAHPAVTIAVAKRKGTNAIDVAHRVTQKLDTLKGTLVPADVHLTITRDYGETAAEKSNELLWHMLLAVLSVSALIWLVLGRREAARRAHRHPRDPRADAVHVLSLRLHAQPHHALRADLLHRHPGGRRDRGGGEHRAACAAAHRRVRRADGGGVARRWTKSATRRSWPRFAVVAAILPMAFVGGLMGPYMRPIPIGASAAMVFSLVVAFVVTPWAAVRLLKTVADTTSTARRISFTRLYRRVMGPLLASGRAARLFLAGRGGAAARRRWRCVPLGLVTVKMLPFDNKSEFQVMVDMPDGTALETTARVASALASAALEDETVVDVQQYVGTSAPYNFNGLVRHYFLRRAPHLADLQVNLVAKGERI